MVHGGVASCTPAAPHPNKEQRKFEVVAYVRYRVHVVKQEHSDVREQRGRRVRVAPRRLEGLVVCSSEAAEASAYESIWPRDDVEALLRRSRRCGGRAGSRMVLLAVANSGP
jgi:hypothetical protein